jgi:NAD dependent epimerase/dehydratase family enzyme
VNQPLRLVITGGSGQIGTILARHFHDSRHPVTVISRSASPAPWRVIRWDGAHLGDWVSELDGSDVLINLAVRSVNCRYNDSIVERSKPHAWKLRAFSVRRLYNFRILRVSG